MINYIICDKCGTKENAVGIEEQAKTNAIYKLMISKSLCYKCAWWLNFVNGNPKNLEIIDGYAYIFNPMVKDVQPNMILGQNGKKLMILRKDNSIAVSNDVWTIGKVPLAFYNEYPETAWFINTYAFNVLKARRGNLCDKKGCYDRYHCLVYNILNEKVKYNNIPRDYIVGSERCGSFININKDIRNYNVVEKLIQSTFQVKQ